MKIYEAITKSIELEPNEKEVLLKAMEILKNIPKLDNNNRFKYSILSAPEEDFELLDNLWVIMDEIEDNLTCEKE